MSTVGGMREAGGDAGPAAGGDAGPAPVEVTLLVPGVLRAECAGAAALQFTSEPTLGGLLDQLAARQPRLHRRIRDEQRAIRRYVNVYVDGEDCRQTGMLATPLRDSSQVQVLPSVAGG